jgi:hypothetical protein
LNTETQDAAPIASPARQRLATMITARAEISAAIERAQAALDRLASAQTAEAPLVAELQRLDAAETEAFSAWSRGDSEAPAPTPDVAKRALLTEQLTAARAKAEAARRAEAGLMAERERESSKLPGLARAFDATLAEILAEEGEVLISDFADANRALASKAARIEIMRDIIISMGRAAKDSETGRPFFTLLEAFDGRLQKVSGRLPPDLEVASQHRLGWLALVDRLRSDANAKLES